ncbi:peptidoglycan DD-metalloendopeptidase family protein [Variovorax sp. J22P168]|uniref:murein hydrolase activator EnvC family protein n=1 Tax=Variovorax jilinensis TaxID=3053513 RepID=UPI0025764CA5|nr:peptidoglycan DD-metalloendopeptidase family protein [Variovorax sp. J22P168]MDM0013707.1 peptidoglycan DD-metalloendopeptidase family protein [Variovorax sp. J22P168]
MPFQNLRHGATRAIRQPKSRAVASGLSMLALGMLAACTTPAPQSGTSAPFYPLPPSGQPAPPVAQPPAPPKPQAIFVRPASGRTIAGFDANKNKGLDIAGNPGDPIVAAADGRVVYVGGELRGYGNMVIVQHNDTFLTAYAHTRTILVKEKDVVRQGQKIAEMGNSDADRVKLHFEIRKQGVAVDPEPYLNGTLR